MRRSVTALPAGRLATVLILAATGIVRAQPAEAAGPLDQPADDAWTVTFEPSAWYAAPSARVRLPGTPEGIDRRRIEDFNLDSPRVSPFAELHARRGDWRLSLSAAAISAEDRGWTATTSGFVGAIAHSPGDRFSSSLDYFTAQLTAARRIPIGPALEGTEGGPLRTRLELLGGLRVHRFDFDIASSSGARAGAEEFFAEPMVGARLNVDLVRDFSIDVKVALAGFTAGGDRSSVGGDVVAGFQYNPSKNFGVQIGYRILITSAETGSGTEAFEFDGSFAGLFAGLVFRF